MKKFNSQDVVSAFIVAFTLLTAVFLILALIFVYSSCGKLFMLLTVASILLDAVACCFLK